MSPRSAILICPGRGTYNAAELGWLGRYFPDPALLADFDRLREKAGQPPLSALDSTAGFSLSRHGRGDNASGLIYAATYGDLLSIDPAKVRIVAVTGNSLGWYSALACAGAVSPLDGFRIVNTMGGLMHEAMIGGQSLYPWMAGDWVADPSRRNHLLELIAGLAARDGHALHLSIDLGGMLVLAGNEAGLTAFEAAVPAVEGRFPMRLAHHAAFHTPLQQPVAERGREALPAGLFGQPRHPLIDGRGAIWWPNASDPLALHDYTFGAQVVEPYDFTRAITVAAREFAPDLFILAGPGTTLGGAVAQSLIRANWTGLASRDDFRARQQANPILVSMGIDEQRSMVAD
ncbi:ACP S-malonyltransferase [Paracoccus sp. (in: a-proteobacteria)]|uniref:ACP S-malonyltransferase n=1 Tax=Paracoccus sp. TaxID=267 RepID=UPI003A8A31AA